MTDAGRMREVVTLQQRSSSQDDAGEPVLTWLEVGKRRAEKTSRAGREAVSADQRSGRVPTTFRIRYPTEFTVLPKMRLVHRGVAFEIISCDDRDGRRVDLFLECEELVGEAL